MQLSAGASVGFSGWLTQGCGAGASSPVEPSAPRTANVISADGPPIFVPKTNEGINVHPLRRLDPDASERELVIVPELVALQLRLVYELGFDGIRLTAPFGNRANLLGAIPYVRAARALGIDAVVVLSTFAGLAPAQAIWSDRHRPEMLGLFNRLFAIPPEPAAPSPGGLGPQGVGRIAFQILNEPSLFFGIPPAVYVQEFLIPAFVELRSLNPQILVVSAAEVGTLDGPARVRTMLEAGLEGACDRVAYHIYGPDVLDRLPPHIRQVVWITESGAQPTSGHLGWVRDFHPLIKARLVDATRIFYYDLYDGDTARHRLIGIERNPGGGYRAEIESAELVSYYRQRVIDRAAGRPLIPFDQLIPDITAYFPTPADIAAYDQVSPT
jgi:hypothetical protein